MKSDRRILAGIAYVLFGAVLFGLGFTGIVDEFWSGMGSALIAVGVIRMIHFLRYHKDEEYREKKRIEAADERNQFIRNKSWAWSGYLFVLIAAVLSIVFKLLGQDLLSMASAFAVWILMILYWVCYLVLKKKY